MKTDEGRGAPPPAEGTAGQGASPRTPLYSNAFFVWINQAGTGMAGFAFWALAARLYDADDVGRGSAAFAILTLLSMVSTLGLGLGFIRYYPESGASGPRLANAVFTGSAAVAILVGAVFVAGIPLWAPSLDFLVEQPLYALAFILFVPAGTLAIVQTQAFIAVRKGRFIPVQVLCIQLSRLALPAILVGFFGAFGIVASGGVGRVLGAAVGFALLARGLSGFRLRAVFDPALVFKVLPFAIANYIANFLIIAPGLLLPLLVVNVVGSEEGAFFYIAWFIGFLPISFSTSLGTSLFAEGSHRPQALRALSRSAVMGGLALAAVGAIVLLAAGDRVLLAFGSDYSTEGATLLRIMAVASLPAAVVNVYLGTLRVMKRNAELMIITGIMAVTTVVLTGILLGPMGLEGAGVAHGVAQALGLAIVIARLMTTVEGSMAQRVRGLLGSLGGQS